MTVSTVPQGVKQDADTGSGMPQVEASIWTERMVRYADDFVILCRSRAEADQALAEVQSRANGNGLQLHPDKTHVGDSRQAGQGFDFLGYRFEAGKRWVRKLSLMRIKDGTRSKTRRTRGASLERIIADVNPMLRGWYGYFKHAEAGVFRKLDGFLRRRLRALLRKQKKLPGAYPDAEVYRVGGAAEAAKPLLPQETSYL